MKHYDGILEDAQSLFAFLSEAANGPERTDIVLAMGSQDLRVADTAAQAFAEKGAEWLVCSGGLGKDTSELLQEAEGVLYGRRCVELGVPKGRVIVEDRSSNSGENFQFSRTLLMRRGILPRTGTVACKPYMARRAWATGAMQWPEVDWSIACPKISFLDYLKQGNEFTPVLNLMVGDLQRLRVYAGRFQAPTEIPDPIWSAYERLAAAGYDRFVIR